MRSKIEPIDAFLKKFGETGTVCGKNSDIWKKVAGCLHVAGDAYKVMAIREVTVKYDGREDRNHYVIMLHGGNNGDGMWCDYLKNLAGVFEELSCAFTEAPWLIELDNDAVDDVHYVYFGVR